MSLERHSEVASRPWWKQSRRRRPRRSTLQLLTIVPNPAVNAARKSRQRGSNTTCPIIPHRANEPSCARREAEPSAGQQPNVSHAISHTEPSETPGQLAQHPIPLSIQFPYITLEKGVVTVKIWDACSAAQYHGTVRCGTVFSRCDAHIGAVPLRSLLFHSTQRCFVLFMISTSHDYVKL